MKIKAGIVGGAGYTAGELLRILLHHEFVELGGIVSSSNAGNPIHQVHDDLLGDTEPGVCLGAWPATKTWCFCA
ncbi:hypothetical protein ACFQT0_22840 [Hymenobacter humi]|uniref:Semialdehyde dehydrogenase NAD-binding domain-containing protein n=1 Tax=Hymenobacter humi TaxID=1411620 RepID=A0ABW2U973_9BACT